MFFFDILIKNGTIVDGSRVPRFKGDVGISDGKISFVGDLSGVKSSRIIDAKGLMVAPGFIDIHAHSDFSLLVEPKAENRIREGITTEVGGNCGGSSAPITEKFKKTKRFKSSLDDLKKAGLDIDWTTLGEYFERLVRQGISVNFLTLVGFSNIRAGVIGYEDRMPNNLELDEMKLLAVQAMDDGAIGLSTGLTYLPGYYAHTDEIVEIAKIVSKYGGIYASHIREWGSKILNWSAEEGSVVKAVAEAIEIGERSGVRAVQISHMGTKWPMWNKEEMMFQLMEDARKRGVNVSSDIFGQDLSSVEKLSMLLPLWAIADGKEVLLERLKDPNKKAEIMESIKNPEEWSSKGKQIPFYSVRGMWDKVILHPPYKGHLKNRDPEGKTVEQAASLQGKNPMDFVIDTIISEDDEIYQTRQAMNEALRKEQMKHPLMMAGSDAHSMSVDGPHSDKYVNPRIYGAYARMLGRWVREQKALSWEEMIYKMSRQPARTLELWNRGLIRSGMFADIVVFNPNTIIDKATWTEPHQYSEGMEYVLVNGKLVLDNGKHTGALPGKVIKNCFRALSTQPKT